MESISRYTAGGAMVPATKVTSGELQCSKCHSMKPDEQFSTAPQNARRRGKSSHCKQCRAAAMELARWGRKTDQRKKMPEDFSRRKYPQVQP